MKGRRYRVVLVFIGLSFSLAVAVLVLGAVYGLDPDVASMGSVSGVIGAIAGAVAVYIGGQSWSDAEKVKQGNKDAQ